MDKQVQDFIGEEWRRGENSEELEQAIGAYGGRLESLDFNSRARIAAVSWHALIERQEFSKSAQKLNYFDSLPEDFCALADGFNRRELADIVRVIGAAFQI